MIINRDLTFLFISSSSSKSDALMDLNGSQWSVSDYLLILYCYCVLLSPLC